MSATGRMWRRNWRLDSRYCTRSVSQILDIHEVYSVGMAGIGILWGWQLLGGIQARLALQSSASFSDLSAGSCSDIGPPDVLPRAGCLPLQRRQF
jgi:hypothetical protein